MKKTAKERCEIEEALRIASYGVIDENTLPDKEWKLWYNVLTELAHLAVYYEKQIGANIWKH